MVVFTCQHCGSAVNKNKVDKHYTFECRNSPYVTCIDCLKDFRGNEYVAHTQCVTEEERYAPKGFVAKTPPSVKKRATWLNSVESSLNTPGLTPVQKTFIKSLLDHPNIPQKRKKFQNFVKSIFARQCPGLELVDGVFDIFEETHRKSLEEEKSQNTSGNKVAEVIHNHDKNDNENNLESNNVGLSDGDNCSVAVDKTEKLNDKANKKKKKSKSISESSDLVNSVDDVENAATSGDIKENDDGCVVGDGNNLHDKLETKNGIDELNGKGTKKKKNKKKRSNSESDSQKTIVDQSLAEEGCDKDIKNGLEVNEENNSNDSNLECDKKLSKKERKEKKKRAKYEAELNEIENNKNLNEEVIENNVEGCKEGKKKKKKDKKKNLNENGVGNEMNNEVNGINENKSKRRRNDENEIEEPIKKKSKAFDSEDPNECTEMTDQGEKNFNWSDMIIKVLESRSDKELSVNRLSKKLINEYQAIFGENHMTYEKLLSKFNKKLYKTPGVKVLKDKAKLKT